MSVCVLQEVFMNQEIPAGFGEIVGKAFGKKKAWRQTWSVPPEEMVGSRGQA